jgi:hypothetical protein
MSQLIIKTHRFKVFWGENTYRLGHTLKLQPDAEILH